MNLDSLVEKGIGSRKRARIVAEDVLAGLDERGVKHVYIRTLGVLVVATEAYYCDMFDDEFIEFERGGDQLRPDVVREALCDVFDDNPSRIAYDGGKRSKRVYGWQADRVDDEQVREAVDALLDEWDGEREEIETMLEESRPFPWK